MTDNSLSSIDVLTLLPQRPPFVMIDRLTWFDQSLTTTQFTPRADNLFMDDGGRLNACGLVEVMAQTCAARMGYINCYIYKQKVQIGFIGGIKNLQILRRPCLGETLTTTVEVVQQVMQMTLVQATVKVGSETIATGEMKIALKVEN